MSTMYTVHHIYIGARNTPLHKFLPNDEIRVVDTLKKYLMGWTITMGRGFWEDTFEETMILTVLQSPDNKRKDGNGLTSAVGEIASVLKQYSIMWESNGSGIVVDTTHSPVAQLPPKKTEKPETAVNPAAVTATTVPAPEAPVTATSAPASAASVTVGQG